MRAERLQYKENIQEQYKVLLYQEQIYILKGPLCKHIFDERHNFSHERHFRRKRTVDSIARDFWWPKLHKTIALYVKPCNICMQAKQLQCKPFGLFHILPIPTRKWASISLDYILNLLKSNEHATILEVVCCCSKQAIFYHAEMSRTKKK